MSQLSKAMAVAMLAFLLCGHFQSLAQVGQKLIVNGFSSDPTVMQTFVIVSDVDGIGPNVKVSIFHEDGRLVYEKYEKLQSFGKLKFNPLQYLNAYQHGYNQNPKFRGTVRIETDGGNIMAQYWEYKKGKGSNTLQCASTAMNGDGVEQMIFQNVSSDKGFESSLVLSNAESNRSVTANVKFYSDEGGVISTERFVIPQNGALSLDIAKAMKGLNIQGTAYVNVVGPGKISGEYRQKSKEGSMMVSIPGVMIKKIR